MEVIFDGDDVVVFIDRSGHKASEIVVFSFSGHGMHKHENPRYGDGFLQKVGATGVFFTTKGDHWWQTREMPGAIEAANRATLGIRRRVTYGQSMGGFGAACFAQDLGAEYLVTAPQLSIRTSEAKLHQVWMDGFASRERVYPNAARRMSGATGSIIYDSIHPMDTTHANLLKGLPGKHRRLIVPLASHFVPRTLTEMGVLSSIISDLIVTPNADLAQHRREIRCRRLRSSRYVEMLTLYLRKRESPGLWLLAEQQILREIRTTKVKAADAPHLYEFLTSYDASRWGNRADLAREKRKGDRLIEDLRAEIACNKVVYEANLGETGSMHQQNRPRISDRLRSIGGYIWSR
ncbi:hypothetical protein [Paenirhodobacter populi]|uniref:Alpha/beta hydrolase n=1 Tax=Paenirhodobacter populi TaxID=2306993 RepID=A0A443IQ90_9RHOB|nr:hypothetical protein [Sinirhodobacter populi]RWR08536.1 hypothetical protein D2T33_15685 [Sinirhodobacter populi]